jgi:hypothetical protein
LQQREALLDVALHNGLSPIIGMYVLALDSRKDFLLKEPVAVQAWAARHLEAIQQFASTHLAAIFAGKQSDNHPQPHYQPFSSPSLSSSSSSSLLVQHGRLLNGLCHVVEALLQRLDQGQACFPLQSHEEVMQLTRDGRVFLKNLLSVIGRLQLQMRFAQWLLEHDGGGVHYVPAKLRRLHVNESLSPISDHTRPISSSILATMLRCARLPLESVLPVPETIMELWHALFHEDTLDDDDDHGDHAARGLPRDVSTALLLFFALDMVLTTTAMTTNANVPHVHGVATRFSQHVPLDAPWVNHVTGLWCIAHNFCVDDAAALILPDVPIMDRAMHVAVLHALLSQRHVDVAKQFWTWPQEASEVPLLLDLCVATHEPMLAWQMVRAVVLDMDKQPPPPPPHQHQRQWMEKLLAYHHETNTLRELLHAMTWTHEEAVIVAAFLMANNLSDECALLYLTRYDVDDEGMILILILINQSIYLWSICRYMFVCMHGQNMSLLLSVHDKDTTIH